MTQPPAPNEAPEQAGQKDQSGSLADELRALIAEARAAFDSEIAFQKARVSLAAKLAARIAGFGMLVLALLFFVLMALVVGLLLALAPMLTAWGALAAVVAGLLLATALTGLAVRAALRRLMRILGKGAGE